MADLSTQQLAVLVTSQLLVGKHNPSRDELETAAERAFDLISATQRAWEKAFPDHPWDLV